MNKIIANLHEAYTFLNKEINNGYKPETLIENYKKILIVITPIIPHFANECLQMINKNLEEISWPKYDKTLIEENEVNLVIQINGKKRGLLKIKKDKKEDEIHKLIMKDEKIKKYLVSKEIKKKIYIKNKLINIII